MPDRLDSMKNPSEVLRNPGNTKSKLVNPFVAANYNVLLSSLHNPSGDSSVISGKVKEDKMKSFLDAGFALSDIYCAQFFRNVEETQRRRKFGRALTNDLGTALSTLLGLASAGQNVVTATATATGLADNAWRNYDEAFVVSADFSNVRALVVSAQKVFKYETSKALPPNYSAAYSVLLTYDEHCSTLGMQALLNQSVNQQKKLLQDSLSQNRDQPERSDPGQSGEVADDSGSSPQVSASAQPVEGRVRPDTAPAAIPQFEMTSPEQEIKPPDPA
ncbi:MAG: hypothetical protein ACXIUO_04395 [Erythrobacter sp.]